jgi:hypothetical protein
MTEKKTEPPAGTGIVVGEGCKNLTFINPRAVGNAGDGLHLAPGAHANIIGGASIANKGHGYAFGKGASGQVSNTLASANGGMGYFVDGNLSKVPGRLGLPADIDLRTLAESMRGVLEQPAAEQPGWLMRVSGLGWRAIVDSSQVVSAVIAFAQTPAGQEFIKRVLG